MGAGKEVFVGVNAPVARENGTFINQIASGFVDYCLEHNDLIDKSPSDMPDDPYGLAELFLMYLDTVQGGSPTARKHPKVIPPDVLFSRFLENVSFADINPAVGQISEGYPPRKLAALKRKIDQTVMAGRLVFLERRAE